MTDPHDHGSEAVDRAGRAASQGLRAHVDRHIDPEIMLSTLPAAAPGASRGRLLAAAAVAVLFIGSVTVLGDGPGDGDERSRLELDQDGNRLPAPEPGTLTPLGPSDGRDSIQLPIQVEPNVDLDDRQIVQVSGSGFVPGERVGIVQCAREAGGEVREQRAGIDGCNVGTVRYADAGDDGSAAGTFTVRRVLTTPATGTVDCAAEAERCIVAMGALNDYDRSGGLGVAFQGGGEPIDIPTVTVSPAEGLADGDTVHIEGEGFAPGPVMLSQCSIDPAGCWTVGEEIRLSASEVEDVGLRDQLGGAFEGVGLIADRKGRVTGDVKVWRFLPGPDPTSYIDCSVSRCALRFSSYWAGFSGDEAVDGASLAADLAPAPPRIGFTGGGPGPRPPAIAVEPSQDLEPGDEVVVRGAGFRPGSRYAILLCAGPPGDPAHSACVSTDDGDAIDGDGGFARRFELPHLRELAEQGMGPTATTACAPSGDCGGRLPSAADLCDGVSSECTVRVEAYTDDMSIGPPQFPAAPVVITLRR